MLTRRQFLAGLGLLAVAADVPAATRLLMSAKGSGGFTLPANPAPTTVTALTAAPGGGWTWFNGPCAVRDAAHSRTIVAYVKGTNGDIACRTIDDTTLSVSAEQVPYPAFEVDDHDAPSVLIRASDGYVCLAFAMHVDQLYFAKGASSGALPTGLGDVTNITSSAGSAYKYTYAQIAQLSSEANTIYIFVRATANSGGLDYLSYTKSTDNGATWGAIVRIAQESYHQIAVSGTDRIDFVCSPHPEDALEHSIYHFYMKAGLYYRSDGTQITASLPFAVTDMTKVYDGSSTWGWMWDVAMGLNGKPVITFSTFPGNDGSDHRYQYAEWTGAAWSVHEIVAGGGRIPTGNQPGSNPQAFYSGGVVLDRADPRNTYCSVGLGGGRWDVYRYRTTDSGASFTSTALTSSGKNVRPFAVQGAHTSLQVVCMTGTYTTYVNYSVGTTGFGV